MNPAEVVMHIVECHGMSMVRSFLAVSIGQPGKPAHLHPHGEVLALYVGRGYMVGIGIPDNRFHVTANALAGGIASLILFGR